jgi:outer membrane lipoprotein SlyB
MNAAKFPDIARPPSRACEEDIMERMRTYAAVVALTAALPLAGCADNYYRNADYGARPVRGEYRTDYGVVEGIDYVPGDRGGPSRVGAVVGGVAGGILGHQIGGGRGNTAATIAGAIGGAVVGNEVQQRNRRADEDVRVTVRMDDGSYRSVIMADEPNVRPGDRVVIDNGRIFRR